LIIEEGGGVKPFIFLKEGRAAYGGKSRGPPKIKKTKPQNPRTAMGEKVFIRKVQITLKKRRSTRKTRKKKENDDERRKKDLSEGKKKWREKSTTSRKGERGTG